MTIPDPERKGLLPKKVPFGAAELSASSEAPEASPYRISFAEYKEKECQMDSMTPVNAKATLKTIRDVGVHYTSKDNYSSNARGVEMKTISRGGDYLTLYRGLPDDSEIREIKCKHPGKEIDIRLFFFTLEKERTFYLVAAKQTHIDTSKGDYRKRLEKKHRRF